MTILMVFGLFLVAAEAFHVGSRTGASGVLSARAYSRDVMTAQNAKKKDRMELENIDGFEPKVDWDAEMKKLNERRGQSEDRPADVEVEGPRSCKEHSPHFPFLCLSLSQSQ